MEMHSPNLYKTKMKLLKNLKLETKKAIEIASKLLKDDKAMDSFSMLIQNYFQNTAKNNF